MTLYSRLIHDDTYLDLLHEVLTTGAEVEDRTGVGTKSIFGCQMEFDLKNGFPLLTTKRLHWPSIVWELLWFMGGHTNSNWLNKRGVTIWNEWADEDGELGPIYGKQWRDWNGHDQLQSVVDSLRSNPKSRRHIVSAWNVADIPEMKLPPCHLLYQFYARPTDAGHYLDIQVYQRSCDLFLGVPFNIASYSLLLMIMGRLTRYKPGRLIWIGGDTHIYLNHLEQAKQQLNRDPKPSPTVTFREDAPLILDADWSLDNFDLIDYRPHPPIKAPIAI